MHKAARVLGNPTIDKRLEIASATVHETLLSLGQTEPPINLASLSKALGVARVGLASIGAAAILQASEGEYRIILKKGVPRTRSRFSWAHELGHLLLDRPTAGVEAFRGIDQKQIEYYCDRMAAEILMPRHMFAIRAKDYNYNLHSVPKLADIFLTSREATVRRLLAVHPEHCILSAWEPPSSRSQIPRLKWSFGNGAFDFQNGLPSRQNTFRSNYFGCIIDAMRTHGIVRRIESTAVRERWGNRSFVREALIPTDAWAVGSGVHRMIFTWAYLDQEVSSI